MRHELKTWPEYFRATQDNKKLFELREDDRGFKIGDELHLREFDPCTYCKGKGRVCSGGLHGCACADCRGEGGRYTGSSMHFSVTFILRDHPGVRSGYVIMGLYNLASGDAFV